MTCLDKNGIHAEVFGREKHLYSIYDKMKTKRKSFAEIMDVYAFRIIVRSVDNCYRSMGAVHNLYKPVAGRFKDYIAIPKANGYQSLHTTLFGMHGIPIEIQIRTNEMETFANNGIAGHYLYKSNEESDMGSHERAREWMKGLLEIQQSAGNSLEFIEHVKFDLFPDEVYVFSPVGEIFDLPQGSTPVDFASTLFIQILVTAASHVVSTADWLLCLQHWSRARRSKSYEHPLPNPTSWLAFCHYRKSVASDRLLNISKPVNPRV